MALDIRFTDAPLGHEIRGVDLSGEIDDAVFAQIERAFDEYGVVVFRDQKLAPEQQVRFSRRFGPLDHYVLEQFNLPSAPEVFVISNIVEDGKPVGMADAGRYWHTDMWLTTRPPRGSILHALEVPVREDGEPLGDTWFASTAAAYDALPDDLKARVDGRKAVFSTDKYLDYRRTMAPGAGSETGKRSQAALEKLGSGDIEHFLVREHPRTGRKCLYICEHVISRIAGLDREESDRLIAELERHVVRPEFVYRHRWRVGDVVMWDNCSCIHKATGDFELPLRRLMHRTTLSGSTDI
jgi:taurine dioxygenase